MNSRFKNTKFLTKYKILKKKLIIESDLSFKKIELSVNYV
jgi:hypothetical protein